MPYPYLTIQELQDEINLYIVANGLKKISGSNMNDVLNGLVEFINQNTDTFNNYTTTASFVTFSGSYFSASGSNSTNYINLSRSLYFLSASSSAAINQGAVNVDRYTLTSSFNSFTSSYTTTSASFDTRIRSISSSYSTDSASFLSRITAISGAYTPLSVYNPFTASYKTDSASISSKVINLSSSYNTFTGSYYVVSDSFDSRIRSISSSALSGSYLLKVDFNAFTASYKLTSSSFDTRIDAINNTPFVFQESTGTQSANQIPIYTDNSKEITKGTSSFKYDPVSGTLTVRSISYRFPTSQGGTNTFFRNDGSGNITWSDLSFLATTSSFQSFTASYGTASSSFNTRINNLSSSNFAASTSFNTRINSLTGSNNVFTQSYYIDSSSVYNTFIIHSESIYNISSSLGMIDTGSFVTTSSYNVASASFDTRIRNLSSSYSVDSGSFLSKIIAISGSYTPLSVYNPFTASYLTVSASISSKVINLSSSYTSFTQSYYVDSASFDTRIRNISASTSAISDSSVFNTFTASYYVASNSFDSRIKQNVTGAIGQVAVFSGPNSVSSSNYLSQVGVKLVYTVPTNLIPNIILGNTGSGDNAWGSSVSTLIGYKNDHHASGGGSYVTCIGHDNFIFQDSIFVGKGLNYNSQNGGIVMGYGTYNSVYQSYQTAKIALGPAFGNSVSPTINFIVKEVSAMFISSSASGSTRSNVGIGTTTPQYRLDVSGSGEITAQFGGRVIGGDAVNQNEFMTLGQFTIGAADSTSFRNFTASYYTDSASFKSNQVAISSSLVGVSSSYLSTSASLQSRIVQIISGSPVGLTTTSSFQTFTSSYVAASSSFHTRITNVFTSESKYLLTSSYLTDSASFDDRITNVTQGQGGDWYRLISGSNTATIYKNGDFVIRSGSKDGGVHFIVSGSGSFTGEVLASAFFETSLRSSKENIYPFSASALDIINSIDVMSFNYRNNKSAFKIGIIADDAHEYISTREHNKFDIKNTIGLLLKAVQELSRRLDEKE